MKAKTTLMSIGLAVASSCVLFAVAFLFGLSSLIGVLAMFGIPTAALLDWVVPSAFWYWLVPDGGGPLGVLLLVVSAWFQCVVLFSFIFYFLLKRRSNTSLAELGR